VQQLCRNQPADLHESLTSDKRGGNFLTHGALAQFESPAPLAMNFGHGAYLLLNLRRAASTTTTTINALATINHRTFAASLVKQF